MNAIIYLLQVSACVAIFYGFYYFMLNRLTFFTINRFYLLFTLLLSFIIPLLTIHIHQPEAYPAVMQQVVYVNTLQNSPHATTIIAPAAPVVVEHPINWMQLLKIVYGLVAGGLFVQLLVVLIKFFTKLKYNKVNKVGNVNILHGSKSLPNGSFLNYIFLNDDELSSDELQQILAHEMLHIKFMHSVDRIIAKIAQIILWFNPFVYLYVRSIEENHEFEVDREVARSTDRGYYAELLLHLSVAQQGMLYHNFSKVPLKKRISMLFSSPSKKAKRIIYILIIPVIALSCLAFARLKSDDKKPKAAKLYSVIDDIDNVGKNPKVLIDGKAYPKDILYKIGSGCILKSNVLTGKNEPPDGLVTITTKKGVITYMTPYERETLVKIAAIPKSQLYIRTTLKQPDGKPYDKVMIQNKGGGSASVDIPVNGKVGFLIKGKLYSESDFKKLSPKVKDSLFNTTSMGAAGAGAGFDVLHKMGHKNNFSGYYAMLQFLDEAQMKKESKTLEQARKKARATLSQTPANPYSIIVRSENLGKNNRIGKADQVKFPPPIVKSNSKNANVIGVSEPPNFKYLFTYPLTPADNAATEKSLAAINDKFTLFHTLNSIAWGLALRGENLKFAEKLSKQSVDVVNDLLNNPEGGTWSGKEVAKNDLNGYTFMVGDTYAYILYKQGRYAEAVKIQKALWDKIVNKGGGIVTIHLAQMLFANNEYLKAREVAEIGVRSGREGKGIEGILKRIYIKINGNDEGYDQYLNGLKPAADNKIVQLAALPSDKRITIGYPVNQQLGTQIGKWNTLVSNKENKSTYATNVTDTIEYDAKWYNVKPTDHLGDLLKKLPGITVNDGKSLLFNGEVIDEIAAMVIFSGQKGFSKIIPKDTMAAVASMLAEKVDKVQIINPHSNDPNKKITMHLIFKTPQPN